MVWFVGDATKHGFPFEGIRWNGLTVFHGHDGLTAGYLFRVEQQITMRFAGIGS